MLKNKVEQMPDNAFWFKKNKVEQMPDNAFWDKSFGSYNIVNWWI